MGIDEIPTFITPADLAALTGENVASITRGIREGRIPADKVNGRWRIASDLVFANARRESKRRDIGRVAGCEMMGHGHGRI